MQLGDPAPNFTAETTEGFFDFYEFLGAGWGILFSPPADFTPVCTICGGGGLVSKGICETIFLAVLFQLL